MPDGLQGVSEQGPGPGSRLFREQKSGHTLGLRNPVQLRGHLFGQRAIQQLQSLVNFQTGRSGFLGDTDGRQHLPQIALEQIGLPDLVECHQNGRAPVTHVFQRGVGGRRRGLFECGRSLQLAQEKVVEHVA
jgi:hypothetical protein